MTISNTLCELKNISMTEEEDLLPSFNENQVLLASGQLLEAVVILLKNDVKHLSTITGVYQENKLQLLYHFWQGEGITLRVVIDVTDNQVDSITDLIPGALFYEREIVEMFGVKIKGLDMATRMFLPDNWQGGAPMRLKLEVGSEEEMQEIK